MDQIVAEPQQALAGDRGGGAVDRLVVVERIGGAVEVVAELREAGGAGVPVGNAVGRRVRDVEVAGRPGGFQERRLDRVAAADRVELVVACACASHSSSSAKPSIAQARPRVQVLKGE